MQLIIGAGEVGAALYSVLKDAHEVRVRDVEPVDQKAPVIHICFPWNTDFTNQVYDYVRYHDAELVVVHSTVPVGTCDPHEWVHSPVRGRHPHLANGLRVFVKHFGGARAQEAASVFKLADIPTKVHSRAVETEAGKLWELVQYGHNILVQKLIRQWCVDNGIDFDEVYTDFARTYNEGYSMLGLKQFVRPVIKHQPGPIGGHCVTAGARMLDIEFAQVVALAGEKIR